MPIAFNVSSSDPPCVSQKAGPMPRDSISSSALRGRLRRISSGTMRGHPVTRRLPVMLGV